MNLQVDHLAQLHICGIRLYSIFLKKKRNSFEIWFEKEFKRLIELEKRYKKNLVRKKYFVTCGFFNYSEEIIKILFI